MANAPALLVLSTCPPDHAARLAQLVVEGGLAACVNVVEKVESFYIWEGKLNRDGESLLIMKTVPERLEALTSALLAAHPYQVPEVIACEVTGGNPRYLQWVEAQSSPPDHLKAAAALLSPPGPPEGAPARRGS